MFHYLFFLPSSWDWVFPNFLQLRFLTVDMKGYECDLHTSYIFHN